MSDDGANTALFDNFEVITSIIAGGLVTMH